MRIQRQFLFHLGNRLLEALHLPIGVSNRIVEAGRLWAQAQRLAVFDQGPLAIFLCLVGFTKELVGAVGIGVENPHSLRRQLCELHINPA